MKDLTSTVSARVVTLALVLFSGPVMAQGGGFNLRLGNDAWPPFVLEGDAMGTAESLVCQALERIQHRCDVVIGDWQESLAKAISGELDGILAVWKTPERAEHLVFSDAYLTNRIMPVVSSSRAPQVQSLQDLAGLRVALSSGYAYGDDLDEARESFRVIDVNGAAQALQAVRDNLADVALVDELVARQELAGLGQHDLYIVDVVLASRSLHFALSRTRPDAEQTIGLFNTAYRLMLQEGRVNEILNVDWLATDLGRDGRMDIVLRSGVSLADLSNPGTVGSTYALGQSDYQALRQQNFDLAGASYQVGGQSYDDMDSALGSAFDKREVCKHEMWLSMIRCDIEPSTKRR